MVAVLRVCCQIIGRLVKTTHGMGSVVSKAGTRTCRRKRCFCSSQGGLRVLGLMVLKALVPYVFRFNTAWPLHPHAQVPQPRTLQRAMVPADLPQASPFPTCARARAGALVQDGRDLLKQRVMSWTCPPQPVPHLLLRTRRCPSPGRLRPLSRRWRWRPRSAASRSSSALRSRAAARAAASRITWTSTSR